MIDPPFPIPLADSELKGIGEICAILGQIDMLMQETVQWLLNVSVPTAAAVMGSSDARARAGVFEQIITTKSKDRKTHELAADALKRFEKLSGQRNDFVHAFFATIIPIATGPVLQEAIRLDMYPTDVLNRPGGNAVAIKVRNRKHSPVTEIPKIRDEAAATAHLFYQIAKNSFFEWRAEHPPSRGKSWLQHLPRPASPKQS